MGIMGGGSDGSSDGLLFKLAMYCTVIALISTMLVSALLPAMTADYSYQEVEYERKNVMGFTGDSIVNSTPWKLTHVYTPYIYGQPYNIDSDGFLYGSDVTSYDQIGKTAEIKLDVGQKSTSTLNVEKENVTVTKKELKWYYDPTTPFGWVGLRYGAIISQITGQDLDIVTTYDVQETYQTFQFTGYRYVFDPMLPFDYGDGATHSAVDGSLSIVWYNVEGNEGISGGLVVYGKDNTIISNYSAVDIINNYNVNSGFATKYNFKFEGVSLNLNIRFDSDVLTQSIPLNEAWSAGKWSLAITSASAGNFIDIKTSTSFTDSLGSLVDTFINIYKFDTPNIDNGFYDLLLWLLVVFPAELALMFFLKSVFGMAGVAGGLIANIIGWMV